MKRFELIYFAHDWSEFAVCSAIIYDGRNKFIVPQLRENDEYYFNEEERWIEIHDDIKYFIVDDNIVKVELCEWSDYYDGYYITAENNDGEDIDFSLSGEILE
jgi:hypothetical protein